MKQVLLQRHIIGNIVAPLILAEEKDYQQMIMYSRLDTSYKLAPDCEGIANETFEFPLATVNCFGEFAKESGKDDLRKMLLNIRVLK